LREAINSANANAGMDAIEFDDGLSGTIVLASFLPQLTEDVDILGPGAGTITVSGNSLHQPFSVAGGITATFSGLTIANGQAEFGGAISNEGDLTVSQCVFSGNNADFSGGAIDNFGGTLTVLQSEFSGNTTTDGEFGFGGAIANDATSDVSIAESTFSGNSADFSGGALDNAGTVTILRSTFSSNSANSAGFSVGGAIENAGTLAIRNSTFSGNSAVTSGGGIDIFEGEVTVEFSTLTGNSASDGGGIASLSTLTVKNSLVVNSTVGNDCFIEDPGTLGSLGANFATDGSCTGFTQSTPGAINLGPLAENGGPTQTHALQSGSVAIDAATDCTTVGDGPSPVTQDQRSVPRPQGADCDSGSFESMGTPSDEIFFSGFESS